MIKRWGVGLVGLLVATLSGCGEDEGPTGTDEACNVVVGDLAISELMAAPSGEGSAEWFEIYNVSSRSVSLNRLVLSAAGSGKAKTFDVRGAGTLDPRAYFVFGDSAAGFVDSSYDGKLELSNGGGVVSLSCKGTEIDSVSYGSQGGAPVPESGRSLVFDGGVAPDGISNDQGASWCDSPTDAAYDDGANFGSPGAANALCGISMCTLPEGSPEGEMREIVAPGAGDLLVNELFADAAGADDGKEWLELYVASDTAVDLNALSFEVENLESGARVERAIEATACLSAAPGSYVVLANGESVPGATVVMPTLSFSNGVGFRIKVRRGDTLVDDAVLPAGKEGESVRLDAGVPKSSDANDVAVAFCTSGAGAATPGAPNGLCGLLTCRDGDSVRPVVAPEPGDLVINEVFSSSANGGGRDWLELYVSSSVAVDLNGLVIRNAKTAPDNSQEVTLASENCIEALPGDYYVIATKATDNGGVSPDAVLEGLSLYNNTALTVEISRLGVLLDAAAVPNTPSGASATLRADAMSATGNDLADNFCIAQTGGLFEEKGTPGSANVCGAACLEGGSLRSIVAPAVGDLVITEIYANPPSDDAGRDWLEVYVAASHPVDLNGVTVLNSNTTPSSNDWLIESGNCLSAAPGSYVVIAGKKAVNEGVVSLATIGTDSASLFYSSFSGSATLQLEAGETVIDAATYPSQSSSSGASYQLDADILTSVGNDSAAAWCKSTNAGVVFTGGKGSPGLVNAQCP